MSERSVVGGLATESVARVAISTQDWKRVMKYAIVIGINEYLKNRKLHNAEHDAKSVASFLSRKGYRVTPVPTGFDKGRPIMGKGASSAVAVGIALRQFCKETAVKQDALIYYAGHGFLTEAPVTGHKKAHLAASDSLPDGTNTIPFEDFLDLVRESDFASLVVLLDCCYAGALIDPSFFGTIGSAFTREHYWCITSCRDHQKALDKAHQNSKHGVFTEAMLHTFSEYEAKLYALDSNVLVSKISDKLSGYGQEVRQAGYGSPIKLFGELLESNANQRQETNPYQGLSSFNQDSAQFFFGRESDIRSLCQLLEQDSQSQSGFAAIVGASGRGKSSLVRAGLISLLPPYSWMVLPVIRPGAHPLEKLKAAVLEPCKNDPIREADVSKCLESGDLVAAINIVNSLQRVLLVLDQFEEIFTLADSNDETKKFVELLTKASLVKSNLFIIITMRTDFLDRCTEFPLLRELLEKSCVYPGPLTGERLRAAIEKPALAQGYQFCPELTDKIMDEIGLEKDSLPLLEVALQRLWEFRDQENGILNLASYEKLTSEHKGGLHHVLDDEAERAYKRLEEHGEWIKRICLKLVSSRPGVKDGRQRRSKQELLSLAQNSDEKEILELILKTFIDFRLFVIDGDMVDLAHEAIMGSWKRFAEWLDDERSVRYLIARMNEECSEWESEQRPERLFMSDKLLYQAEAHRETLEKSLTPETKDFWKQSQKLSDWRKVEHEILNQTSKANQLMKNPTEALIKTLALVGKNLELTPGKILAQLQTFLYLCAFEALERNVIQAHDDAIDAIAFSPDGSEILSAAGRDIAMWKVDGSMAWQKNGAINPATSPGLHEHLSYVMIFSPDGSQILLGNGNELHFLARNSPLINKMVFEQGVTSVIKKPDNTIIAGLDRGSIAIVHPDGSNEPLHTLSDQIGRDLVIGVFNSCLENQLIVGFADGDVVRWDMRTFQIMEKRVTGMRVRSMAVSHDETFVMLDSYGSLKMYGLKDDWGSRALVGHSNPATTVAYDSWSELFLTAGEDDKVQFWTTDGVEFDEAIEAGQCGVSAVSVSADGQSLATGGFDGTIKIWDLTSAKIRESEGHDGYIHNIVVAENGTIATASEDGTIRLWTSDGAQLNLFRGEAGCTINGLAFFQNDKLLVSLDATKTLTVSDLNGCIVAKLPNRVTDFAANSRATNIFFCSENEEVFCWDPITNKCFKSNIVHGEILEIIMSDDGQSLLTRDYAGVFKRWTVTGESLGNDISEGSVPSCALSPDGSLLAIGDGSGKITVFDLLGERVCDMKHGNDLVMSLVFSPDGSSIVSGNGFGNIQIWDLNGNEIGKPMRHGTGVFALRYAANGTTLLSGGDDNNLHFWHGSWRSWLQVCGNRLRHHPLLLERASDDAKLAHDVCQKHVWNK